jgi:hypothetical protein
MKLKKELNHMAPSKKTSSNDRDKKTHTIQGAIHWAQVVEPNTTFEPMWCLDLSLTPATRKIVEDDGLTVKNKGDARGDFISLKHKVTRQNGDRNDPPRVIDSQLNEWDGRKLIGNGSIANVRFAAFNYDHMGKSGRTTDLVGVQIINLVEYSRDGFDVVADGYTVGVRDMEEAVPF